MTQDWFMLPLAAVISAVASETSSELTPGAGR